MIVAGATAYPRIIDPEPFREIADEVGALFMFDAAHIAGLIAGGVHPNPVPYADIVTFTTHKTLRGPRGGCILSQAEHGAGHRQGGVPRAAGRPARARHRGQGGGVPRGGRTRVHATTPRRSSRNAAALAEALAGEGFRLVSGGTDNHLMLVDLRTFDAELTGKKAQAVARPGRHHASTRTPIPDDPRSPFVTSGLRIGTPAVTTQGMGEAEMAHDRRADRPGAAPPRATTPSWRPCATTSPRSARKFTPYP